MVSMDTALIVIYGAISLFGIIASCVLLRAMRK